MSASVEQSSFQHTADSINRGDSLWVTLAHAVCDFINKIWNWFFPPAAEQVEVRHVDATIIDGEDSVTHFVKRESEYMKDLESFIGDYIDRVYPDKNNRGMDGGYGNLHTYLCSKNPPPFHTIEEFIWNNYLLADEKVKDKEKVIRSIYTLVFAKNHPQLMMNQNIKIEELSEICMKYKPYISSKSLASSGFGEAFHDTGPVKLNVPKTAEEFKELKESGIDGAFVEAYFRGKCWRYVSSDINEKLCLAYIEGYGKNQDQELLVEWTNALKGRAL